MIGKAVLSVEKKGEEHGYRKDDTLETSSLGPGIRETQELMRLTDLLDDNKTASNKDRVKDDTPNNDG
jgi:hypothetical protein